MDAQQLTDTDRNMRATQPEIPGASLSSYEELVGVDPERVQHCTLPFDIVTAGEQPDGSFRVTGYMNTFKVMHSRELVHPAGFQKWLQKTHHKARLPMLANHGIDLPGFASVGTWDRFEYHKDRGMLWSGTVGKGTQLTDDARTLLKQRILQQLSLGAVVRKWHWVKLTDDDIEPEIKQAMEEAEVDEIRVRQDWYPVEGSIVDVANDPGARIAARAGMVGLEKLAKEVAELRGEVEQLKAGGSSPEVAAMVQTLREHSAEFIEDFKDCLVEALASDEVLGDTARAFREDFRELVDGETDDELAGLRERVAGFGKKRE